MNVDAVTVTNSLSKSGSYTYNGSLDTLALDESKNYQVKAHTQPPQTITVPGGMSVSMVPRFSGNEYIFEGIPPIIIHVLNTQKFNVRIAEKSNYIESTDGNPFIRAEGLIPRPLGRYKGYETRLQYHIRTTYPVPLG
jgi:hypothetical protein